MKEVAKEILNKDKFKDYFINEMLGRFVGFVVGIWTSSLFTKVVYEKRGFKNLFGLVKRKKIVVNTTPEWLQFVISIIVGYIMLELVNYIIKNKKYKIVTDPIVAYVQRWRERNNTASEQEQE